ncbi:MAG: protein translocase subunit SecD [Clostridia bacterium]
MKKQNVLKLIISVIVICVLCYIALNGVVINKKEYVKSAKKIQTGLDISGGVSIVYEADTDKVVTDTDLNKAVEVLRKRLEGKNIYDATTRADSSKGYIYLEIPADIKGKADPLKVVEGLDKTAIIQFKDEQGNVILAGTDVASAEFSEDPVDNSGLPEPHVVLKFSEEGRKKFREATKKNVGKQILIFLDDQQISDPFVNQEIDSPSAIITLGGKEVNAKRAEAKQLSMLISSGALPFSLKVINKEFVGPTIGQQALEVSILAGGIALALVIIFMLCVYRVPGIVSALSLITYTALFLLLLAATGITLTLPGIASLILSIGMAVDANVIIFERLKEEIKIGRSVEKAFENSFSKALTAIIDGNITTLIIALFLYIFGIGTIKGFGMVLGVGVLLSMFTSIFITKFLLKQLIGLAKNHKEIFAVKGAK